MTSTLTEAHEAAAQKVSSKQAAKLATFGRGKVAISDPEHRRLIDEAQATYAAAGAAMNRLAVFEDELAGFTGRVGLSPPPRCADRDVSVRAHEFQTRATRVTECHVRAPTTRPLVMVPDFNQLIAGRSVV